MLEISAPWAGDPSLMTRRREHGREEPAPLPAEAQESSGSRVWTPPNAPKTHPSIPPVKGGNALVPS